MSSIEIPNTITTIGDGTFSSSGLNSVIIPNSVRIIGDFAFYSTNLSSVVIPNSVTSIGKNAFCRCYSLTSVEISNSVTSIGNEAFESCYNLNYVEIPSSVASIGPYAFFRCNIEKVEFASIEALCNISFGNIYANPLYYANRLYINKQEVTELIIPETVVSIGACAFAGCSNLTLVEIPNSVVSIGDFAFIECRGLTSIDIPTSVTYIGEHAFFSCQNLTSVEIPKFVNYIGESAFSCCSSLPRIEIPNSVVHIGKYAFSGCGRLTSVYYGADEPIVGNDNIFDSSTYKKATLYMTENGAILANTINPWKNFNNIQKYDFSGIDEIVSDFNANEPYEVYNIRGVMVGNSTDNLAPGLYIVRQGQITNKVAVK